MVSETFFFDFSQAICGGVSQTGTRSVFLSPGFFTELSFFFFVAMSTSAGQFSKQEASWMRSERRRLGGWPGGVPPPR
jgi:hypothetical protein